MGIADYFGYVIGADSVTHHKPDPEPVVNTLQTLGLEPSEVIVVGDMPVDILMARNASARSVGVTYGNSSREDLEAAGADYVIDSIEELLSLL
jgi:phosphoglycolate phosphatase